MKNHDYIYPKIHNLQLQNNIKMNLTITNEDYSFTFKDNDNINSDSRYSNDVNTESFFTQGASYFSAPTEQIPSFEPSLIESEEANSTYSYYSEDSPKEPQSSKQDLPTLDSKPNYKSFFEVTVDDKLYSVGEGDDQLSIVNNKYLQEILEIVNGKDAHLNELLDGLFLNCPWDKTEAKAIEIRKTKFTKRMRLSKTQIRELKLIFGDKTTWSKEYFKKVPESLGLSEKQVYNWFYNELRKKSKAKAKKAY